MGWSGWSGPTHLSLVRFGALRTPRTGPDGQVRHRTFQPCNISNLSGRPFGVRVRGPDILFGHLFRSGPCPADKIWGVRGGRDANKKEHICTQSARTKKSVRHPSNNRNPPGHVR